MSTGIGETLRESREEQGRSIEDAARWTRVRSDHLRALEAEEFGVFGGDVYAKGFLKSYATYLGLDPEPLLATYRHEVAHEDPNASTMLATPLGGISPQRGAPPMWIAWLLVGAVVLGGLFVVGSLFGGRTPTPAAQEPPVAPAESPTTEPEDGGDETDEPTERASPTPSPPDGVELLLVFEEDCWIDVEVDGQQVEQGTIPSGETRPYDGDEEVTIRFGNPGGVRVELNGEDLGAPGEPGQPETVTFTEDGPQGQSA